MNQEPNDQQQSPAQALLAIESLMPHRQVVFLQEWLQAQLPWRRCASQRVSERIRDAA